MAHVKNNSGNNEWYTPPEYIEAARSVMGSIDLDPATNSVAQEWVKAAYHYTKENDGLTKEWVGNIWLNPPYARGLIEEFVFKLVGSSYNQAICLTNNATETKWGSELLKQCSAVCFPKGRIKYISEEGVKNTPLQAQMFTYFGPNYEDFMGEFSQFGVVMPNRGVYAWKGV